MNKLSRSTEKPHIRSTVGTVAAAISIAVLALNGVGSAGANPLNAVIKTTTQAYGETAFATGDRLKITVYEKVGSDSDGTSAPLLSTLVEHTEMTGEYTVQLDGTVFLPLIGNLNAAGQTGENLQKALADKAATVFPGRATVIVRLVKREPVYVTGRVPRPGTFEYTPGMMVLNATILAGISRSDEETWRHLDIARMTEHLNKANAKLAELLARRDVLRAQRDGSTASASPALLDLVGPEQASARITEAARLAGLKVESEKKRQESLDKTLAALEKERTILIETLTDAAAALKHKEARVKSVSALHRKRIVTDNTYYSALGDLDTSKSQWNELRASIARLEQRIVDTNRQKAEAIFDAEITREREIESLQSSIREAMVTRATIQPALTQRGVDTSPNAPATLEYMIIRRSRSGIDRIVADKFTPLKPGDIVEVVQDTRLRVSTPNTLD